MQSKVSLTAIAIIVALVMPVAGGSIAPAAASGGSAVLTQKVDRLSAASRFDAAVALSRAGFTTGAPVVFIASATSPTEALLAGPAAARSSAPVLLTNRSSLPAATVRELKRLRPVRIVVVGSTTSVGPGVERALARSASKITRIAGSSASSLTRNLTRFAFKGFTRTAYVSAATSYAEVLAASAAAAKERAPLIVVPRNARTVGTATRKLLISLHVSRLSIVGDVSSVNATVARSFSSIGRVNRIAEDTPEAMSLALNRASANSPAVYFAKNAADPSSLALPALAGRLRIPVYLVAASCVDSLILIDIAAQKKSHITIIGSVADIRPSVAQLTSCQSLAVAKESQGSTVTGPEGPVDTASVGGTGSSDAPSESASTPTSPASARAVPTATPAPSASEETGSVALPTISNARLRFGVVNDGGPTASERLEATSKLAGEVPSLLEFYEDFTRPAPVAKLTAAAARGATPVLTWEPRSWNKADSAQSAYRLDRIADGEFDAYIEQYARDLSAWGQPVMLRFGHEMNGDWYPWSERRNGNSPGDYVAAWRHVHDLFEFAGASNVEWIWSPNVPDGLPTALASVYPGAAYVDVVALDGYNWGSAAGHNWTAPGRVFAEGLAQLRTIAPDKPIIVAETASSEAGGSKAMWILQLVAFLNAQPDVLGMIWFDLDKETNWRIDSSDAAASAFRVALAARR